ncbi:hypothetical protein B0H13DRAFT_2676246 [Mycena leptocephala]|nr:hypothetical protein B0H13DRAFT_2676246 [Mycena leptocephala]
MTNLHCHFGSFLSPRRVDREKTLFASFLASQLLLFGPTLHLPSLFASTLGWLRGSFIGPVVALAYGIGRARALLSPIRSSPLSLAAREVPIGRDGLSPHKYHTHLSSFPFLRSHASHTRFPLVRHLLGADLPTSARLPWPPISGFLSTVNQSRPSKPSV